MFTHDRPLGKRATLKWKPENTVDLLLRLDDGCVEAFINRGAARVRLLHVPFGGGQLRVCIQRNHMLECTLLAARRTGAGQWVDIVVECICTVDQRGGAVEYSPVKHRPDKLRANSLHTVTETLHNVVESIDVHDLHHIICAASDCNTEWPRAAAAHPPPPPPPPPPPAPPAPPVPPAPPAPPTAPRVNVRPPLGLGDLTGALALPAATTAP